MLWKHYFLAFQPAFLVNAACECGFIVTGNHEVDNKLFLNALETDFTAVNDISKSPDWVVQQFNVTAEAGRGTYGKVFTMNNVSPSDKGISNANSRRNSGVELRVEPPVRETSSVPVAEMDTSRSDFFWGSYRVGLKLTKVEGTCAAFFWYLNDTQEIDMEFLSREFNQEKRIWPVNLVIQSKESAQAGFDASRTGTYKKVNLEFDPTGRFHEYRFDYSPGKVLFYADSKLLAEMEGSAIPSTAGHLVLQHWSNGNPKWSGGPPNQVAAIVASYVKSYFNSSDLELELHNMLRCQKSRVKPCQVQDGTAANAEFGGHFLLDSSNHAGKKPSCASLEIWVFGIVWSIVWLFMYSF